MEFIVISNDEVETGPVFDGGEPVTRVSSMPGSGDESSSGTLEIASRRRVETDVRVDFTPEGVQIIRYLLAAVMVVTAAGFAPEVRGVILQLRSELGDISRKVARGEQGAEAGMIGTSDAAVERNWFVEERAWFGLAKMNVVNRFLACAIRPPRGGF